jgi:hypothetical protein
MRTLTASPRRSAVHDWIVRHDDSRLFIVLYIGLALVLSIAISLFWLVALVALHLAFEYVRFRHAGLAPLRAVAAGTWELKLDLVLVLFALALTLYMDVVMGVLGLQAAGRAGAAAQTGLRGIRFAAWEKVIRGIFLSADDAVQGVRAMTVLRRRPAGAPTAAEAETAPAPARAAEAGGRGWTTGDYLVIGLGIACVGLILAAPWMGHEGWGSVVSALTAELHPFPGG